MLVKDISFPTPQENLIFDDCLLDMADKKGAGEYLRFWESPVYFVVLGRIGQIDKEVFQDKAKARQIEVLRRSSGGGTVVQGPGCLNYSLVLSKSKHQVINDLRQSYQWISQKVIHALKYQGVEAVFRPTSDIALAVNEKKFSGNAQKRGKTYILHHGTILYNFNLDLVADILRFPEDQPVYRNQRAHKDFISNIAIKPDQFKIDLCREFQVDFKPQPLLPEDIANLKKVLK